MTYLGLGHEVVGGVEGAGEGVYHCYVEGGHLV